MGQQRPKEVGAWHPRSCSPGVRGDSVETQPRANLARKGPKGEAEWGAGRKTFIPRTLGSHSGRV